VILGRHDLEILAVDLAGLFDVDKVIQCGKVIVTDAETVFKLLIEHFNGGGKFRFLVSID
jgi:hypothetical protein